MQRNLSVENDGESYTVRLYYAAKAAAIANAFADLYLQSRVEAKHAANEHASTWLRGKLNEMRARLTAANRGGRGVPGAA